MGRSSGPRRGADRPSGYRNAPGTPGWHHHGDPRDLFLGPPEEFPRHLPGNIRRDRGCPPFLTVGSLRAPCLYTSLHKQTAPCPVLCTLSAIAPFIKYPVEQTPWYLAEQTAEYPAEPSPRYPAESPPRYPVEQTAATSAATSATTSPAPHHVPDPYPARPPPLAL